MNKGAIHTPHIHPHSVISGTYYVTVPPSSGAIRFEDPRLADDDGRAAAQGESAARKPPFVDVSPSPACCCYGKAGCAMASRPTRASGQRISVSFNYRTD